MTRGTIVDDWGDGALLEKGAEAPNIPMIALAGSQAENLADYRGRVVVLEFWATWCEPCQPQMERLQTYPDLHPEWSGKVALIAASVDERAETASEHAARKRWNKSHNVWVTKEAAKAFHINALPTIYIIDGDGKVAGTDPSDGIPATVNQLLKSRPER